MGTRGLVFSGSRIREWAESCQGKSCGEGITGASRKEMGHPRPPVLPQVAEACCRAPREGSGQWYWCLGVQEIWRNVCHEVGP